MQIKRLGALILALAVTALAISACGSSGGSSSSSESSGTEPAETTEAAETAESEGGGSSSGMKVGFTMKTFANPVWQAAQKGAEEEAEKLGVELIAKSGNSEENVEEQISIVESMLTQGVEAIVISPTGTGQMAPILERASGEGVKVVVVDTEVPNFEPVTFVRTPETEMSEEVSEFLVENLEEGAETGILNYPEVSSVEERVEGTMNVLKGTKDSNVAELAGNCLRSKAVDSTTDMLQAHSGITGIFGSCGQNATGAVQAIKNAGLVPNKDVKVVGFDGVPEELELIESGELLGTVWQDFPGIGGAAVKAAVESTEGKTVEPEMLIKGAVLSQENEKEFEIQGELVVHK
jgi:ABC-type sugar transport system substrate-binding protein